MARRQQQDDDDLSQFEPDPGAEFVWMIHDEGTVPAQFPTASVPLWQLKGWKRCPAPPDIDPALIERTAPPAPAAPGGLHAEGVNEDA